MASSKLRRAIGAVKDQTSVGLAKVGGRSSSLTELEVAIVKATRHDEYPAEEKYVREILSLTSYSRNYVSACVSILSRRLNRTKNWSVALKTLILIQRMLTQGDKAYEEEIFFATRRGTRLLNMSDFRDADGSDTWDYSAFVRTYALYLDERLDFRMQRRKGKNVDGGGGGDDSSGDEEDDDHRETKNDNRSRALVVNTKPVTEMKTEKIFIRVQLLQQLLDRFLACRPTGNAKNNRVVIVALYPIVKDSFQIYCNITEIMGVLIDRFMELDVQDSIKVYDIFSRVSKQLDELDPFHGWCKKMGVARSSEYPELEKITKKKLDIMDEFIRDKSVLAAQALMSPSRKSNKSEEEEIKDIQEDTNSIKALPAPNQEEEEEEKEETETKKDVQEEVSRQDQEGDLLDLTGEAGDTTLSVGDSLALALFDGAVATETASGPGWEAFDDDSADWETALVKSATRLSSQKSELGGGFDRLLLDGMYQYGAVNASTAYGSSGSASSVAFGSAGRPAASMLALPAPPLAANGNGGRSLVTMDPFAASLEVAPPPYVQMSDMEKKQRLVMEEQMMWDQYNRNGRLGHMQNQQQHFHVPYSMGPYPYTPHY
ncbi:putative clathrin assembly protein [Hirschfeldia incana]|nr:putative clathrin assembly protein [Hirschfeldia incana]